MNTEALFLAEIQAFDPALGTTRILRFATRRFTTKPSETPANTRYDIGLQQPTDIERSLFARASTRGRSTIALGDLILDNPDGELDYLNELAFDSRTLTVRRSTKFAPAYPADFDTMFVGTMEQPECQNDQITLKLRDRFYEVVNAPLQTTKYLGNNALPDGLEGTTELAGKSKPVCLGVVKNVPAPPVNTSKLIYQVNDGPIASVDNVYDRGVELLPGHSWNSAGVVGTGSANVKLYYGGGIWVRINTTQGDGTVQISSDGGATWTLRYTFSGALRVAKAAVYHGGVWLVAGNTTGGAAELVHTNDNFATTTTSSNSFQAMFFHEAASLWVGISGNAISTSPDSLTWTLRHTATFAVSYADGAYGNGIGVAVGIDTNNQGRIASSSDAIHWTEQTDALTTTGGGFEEVTYGAVGFVAVGQANAAASADGTLWARATLPGIAPTFTQIVALGPLYLVGNATFVGGFMASVDGLVWGIFADGLTGIGSNGLATDGVNLVASDGLKVIRYSTPANYGSLADLLDDALAPLPSQYKAYLAGGYFRLGGTPDGIVTADITQGATAADRTAAILAAAVLARVPTAPTFVSGDLTALDADDDSVLGYWTMDDGVTCDQVLDFIAGTPGAAWYPDKAGLFRIAQFEGASGAPALTITQNESKKDTLQRVTSNDQGNGIPIYQVVVQWGRFYQTITTDIAGAVTDAARAEFAQEWRNAPATDASVQTAHPSAGVLTIQSLYTTEADALAEAARQLALRSIKRDFYELTVELNDETDGLDLNDVIEIVHKRYSLSVVSSPSGALSGGGLFRILDVRPNAEAKELTLTVWGRSRYASRVVSDHSRRVTSTGAYRVRFRAA